MEASLRRPAKLPAASPSTGAPAPGSPRGPGGAGGPGGAAMAAILRANGSALGNATSGLLLTTLPSVPGAWPGNGTAGTANNFTAGVDDEFNEDLGYSDLQIVFLACVFTAAPLVAVLLSILAVRFVWRKFQGDDLDDELDGMLRRAETHQSMSQEQLKTSESQFTVLDGASEDAALRHPEGISTVSGSMAVAVAADGGGAVGAAALMGSSSAHAPAHAPHRQTQHNTMSSRSSNGSVITLTMHNNHLIVEKEEIVESSQEDQLYAALCAQGPAAFDQKAIVHQPPARGPGGPALVRQRAETGLSQPDLSSASEGETPPYAYGNQVGYDAGPMGYAEYNGYRPDDPPDQPRQLARTALPTRMTTAAAAAAASSGPRHHHHHHLPVQDSMDVQDLPDDSQQPQRLLSDIQAHEHALQHQREHGGGEASAAVNGDVKLDLDTSTAVAVDDGEEDSTTEDACSVKAQSPPKTLGIGAAPPALDQPLRSPVVDKLRLQDASPLTERFPAPAAPKTPPPPRSPLAAADDRGRAEPGEAGAAGAAGAGGAAS